MDDHRLVQLRNHQRNRALAQIRLVPQHRLQQKIGKVYVNGIRRLKANVKDLMTGEILRMDYPDLVMESTVLSSRFSVLDFVNVFLG